MRPRARRSRHVRSRPIRRLRCRPYSRCNRAKIGFRTNGLNRACPIYSQVPMTALAAADPLAPFSPAVRAWFESSFEAPTEAQARGWQAIARGEHTLIHAPTGSGKTLAAFLYALDRLAQHPSPAPTRAEPGHVRVLYISPPKA